jgi:hypothetical protein
MANLSAIKTLNSKTDDWAQPVEELGKKYSMLLIDHLQPIDEVMTSYSKALFYSIEREDTLSNSARSLILYDKNKRVVKVCENLELIEGKLYLRTQEQPGVGWYNFIRGYFTRSPSVNVKVRR